MPVIFQKGESGYSKYCTKSIIIKSDLIIQRSLITLKSLIIYDSFFGNTEKIAQAIGNTLGSQGETEVVRVKDASQGRLKGLDLLIVGSPTRGFRPSEATLAFLKGLSANSLAGIRVAAFDTRIANSDIKSPILRFMVNFGGYAAKKIADSLTKAGGSLVFPPEGFFVKDSEGPLTEGELERATQWAKSLIAISKK
jgi:flavodoxin